MISQKPNFGALYVKQHVRVSWHLFIADRHTKNKGFQNCSTASIASCLPKRDPKSPAARDEDQYSCGKRRRDLSALAFKIMSDKHMGKLTYIRIYSGSLESGSTIWNATQGRKQRVGVSCECTPIAKAIDKHAGDIVARRRAWRNQNRRYSLYQNNPICSQVWISQSPLPAFRSSQNLMPITKNSVNLHR